MRRENVNIVGFWEIRIAKKLYHYLHKGRKVKELTAIVVRILLLTKMQ